MAIIADLSAFKFTISVDESDIKDVKIGQVAIITADALKNQSFNGIVNKISIIGTTNNGVTIYPVEVMIEKIDNTHLIPGLNVDASIVLSESKDCLIIPSNAVKRGNKVKLVNNDEEVSITTGLNDGKNVEVLSGLNEGDELEIKIIKSNLDNTQRNNNSFRMDRSSGGYPSGGTQSGGYPSGGTQSGGYPSGRTQRESYYPSGGASRGGM